MPTTFSLDSFLANHLPVDFNGTVPAVLVLKLQVQAGAITGVVSDYAYKLEQDPLVPKHIRITSEPKG